ncbi:sensor histidine kinase [Bordetella petrii]|nr:sensor histidine kinase [Bordetella petrii]
MASSERTTALFSSVSQELSRGESSTGFWRAQVVGWIVLAVIGFCIRLAVFGNAAAAFWLTLSLEPLAFMLTSAAAVWHGRGASGRHTPLLVLACSVVLCVAASALLAWIAYAIHQFFPPDTLRVMPENQYRLGFLYYMGILSIWTLVYFGVGAELAARTERISKMKAETHALRLELEHLQSQIEPHFLFNALNTIVAEIEARPAIAEEMTRRLADYLRYSLDRRGQGLCRLDEEIEAAQSYVRIQALRFDRQLEYRCHIDPASLGWLIPHMTLQGLVENAIKHGMRSDSGAFVINLHTRRRDDEVIVAVDNPGQLRAPFDLAKGGGGLGNLCRRLALCYPGRYEFALRQDQDRIVAELRLRGDPVAR